MNIPLNEFEHVIDDSILKRGLSYFNNGAIVDFIELADGEYEASILGTEAYTINIVVRKNIVVEHVCNCPYDLGPVCKHIVAAIFHLQKDELEFQQTKSKKKKTKSVSQQVKELLQQISTKELITFIQEQAKKDKIFRNNLLATFGHLSQNQSKEFYQKQIRTILKTAAGRAGWISWSNMNDVFDSTMPLLQNAEKYLAANKFENVYFISTALIEEMTKAIEYVDDSNGEIGYFIESAIELLFKISKQNIPNNLKQEFFDYCIYNFDKEIFLGWDWHLELLYFATNLAENEKEADIIIKRLNQVKDEYELERAQNFKLILIKKFKGKNEAEEFIKKHISNPSIREIEIKKAIKNKDFEKAILLSKDGIKCDEKEKPGLVKTWYKYLLKIAQIQKDKSNIIKYAKFLFIDNFNPQQDYYQILKDNVDSDKWQPFIEELIKEISNIQSWKSHDLIQKIYINEERWDKLLLLLKQNPHLGNIEDHEKYLVNDYTPEFIEIYKNAIIHFVENNMGRKNYQYACRYLRRMKKLGAKEKVEEIIELFRYQFPKRIALMDELNKV